MPRRDDEEDSDYMDGELTAQMGLRPTRGERLNPEFMQGFKVAKEAQKKEEERERRTD